MAEPLAHRVSTLLYSTLQQGIGRQPSFLLRPYVTALNNGPTGGQTRRCKGTTSNGGLSSVNGGGSKRKGSGSDQEGIYGALNLGKSSKKVKTKLKNSTKHQNQTSQILKLNSKKIIGGASEKKIKNETNIISNKKSQTKNRGAESFISSLTSQRVTGQQSISQQTTQATSLPNMARPTPAITLSSGILPNRSNMANPTVTADVILNQVCSERKEGPVIVLPPSLNSMPLFASANQKGSNGKIKKKKGKKAKRQNNNNSVAPIQQGNAIANTGLSSYPSVGNLFQGHTTTLPVQQNVHTTELDWFDYDLKGGMKENVGGQSVLTNQQLPVDESFNVSKDDFLMSGAPENIKSRVVNERQNNKDNNTVPDHPTSNKQWGDDVPITGYEHLLYNEQRHRCKESACPSNDNVTGTCTKSKSEAIRCLAESSYQAGNGSSLLPNSMLVTQDSLKQDYASNKQKRSESSFLIPVDTKSKGFILVDDSNLQVKTQTTQNKEQQNENVQKVGFSRSQSIVPELKIEEIVNNISAGSFQQNVDALIQSLKTDRWESHVQKSIEKDSKKTTSKNLKLKNKVLSQNNMYNNSTSVSTVPNNTSRLSSGQIRMRDLKPDVVSKSNNQLTWSGSFKDVSSQAPSFGPILSVRPSEISKRKTKQDKKSGNKKYFDIKGGLSGNNGIQSSNSTIGREAMLAKDALPSVLNKAPWSEKLLSTVKILQAQMEKNNEKLTGTGSSFAVSKSPNNSEPKIWSSSAKLLERKREKLMAKKLKTEQQLGSIKNKPLQNVKYSMNFPYSLPQNKDKEYDLKRELKDMYKDQFRENFRLMQYDKMMKSRAATGNETISSSTQNSILTTPSSPIQTSSPQNTIVYTPNSYKQWLSEADQEALKMRKKQIKQNKKLAKKNKQKQLTSNTTTTESPWLSKSGNLGNIKDLDKLFPSPTNIISDSSVSTKPWRASIMTFKNEQRSPTSNYDNDNNTNTLKQRKDSIFMSSGTSGGKTRSPPSSSSTNASLTTSKRQERLEGFAVEKDEALFQEIRGQQQYLSPLKLKGADLKNSVAARRLSNLDGVATMVLERVYDNSLNNKSGNMKKSSPTSLDAAAVLERYKQALRRYNEKTQRDKEEKRKNKKNKKIGNKINYGKKNKTSTGRSGSGRSRQSQRNEAEL